jgi:hypothetical protein
MSVSRPFGYNNGMLIPGTLQFGNLVVGDEINLPYSDNYGGVRWWNGPEEGLGYVIAQTNVDIDENPKQPTPNPLEYGSVGFYRTEGKDVSKLIELVNVIYNQDFIGPVGVRDWLLSNGYWTSWDGSVSWLLEDDIWNDNGFWLDDEIW